MSEQQAIHILEGSEPIPENVTVEAVFAAAHIRPSVVTPF